MLFTFCVSNKAPKVRISVLKSSQPCRDNILIAFFDRSNKSELGGDNLSKICASINQDEKRIIENLSVLSFKWPCLQVAGYLNFGSQHGDLI